MTYELCEQYFFPNNTNVRQAPLDYMAVARYGTPLRIMSHCPYRYKLTAITSR